MSREPLPTVSTDDKTSAPAARPRRPTHPWSRGPLLILLAAVVLVLISMLADRLLPRLGARLDRPTRFTLPPDLNAPRTDFEGPYTLATNSRGLRSPEIPAAKPSGITRIVIFGDEQVMGAGIAVPDTFAARIEKQLANTQVINAAVPYAHPLAQARIFYHVALAYEPDLAVFCVSGNVLARMPTRDIKDIKDVFALESPGRGLAARLWPNLDAAWEAERQRSRYLREREPEDFVAEIERIAANKKNIPADRVLLWKQAVARFPALVDAASRHQLDGNFMAFGLLWPDCWPDSLDLGPAHAEKAWHEMRVVLDAVTAEAPLHKVRLALVFIPARVQYEPSYHDLLREFGHHTVAAWLTEPSRFQIALGRWCGDHNVPFLDLTAAFRATPAPGVLSTRYTGRLTAEGHRLIAEQLAAWLTTESPHDS